MIDLLADRPGQLLAETLLHFLWQGAALVLLLKLIEPLLRSVQNRYAASLGTLVVMLMLPFATYCALANRDVAEPASVAKPASAQADVKAMNAVVSGPLNLAPVPVLARLQPVLVGLWMFGVLLLAGRLLVGYAATLWLRGDRKPLPAELALKVAWLGQKLGVATRCRVFLSSRIDEAIAVGCFKPLVLIPLAWATELPPSALEAVIAHELAHIRRWDLWATLLQRLAETLLFYHPAVWWLSRRLSLQRELCCDALAVSATRSPADYVLALETIARRTSAPPLTLATSFLGGGNMNLLDRVRHVLKGGSREASAWWPAGLAALVAPLLAAVALGGWSLLPATVAADEEPEQPGETQTEDESDEANAYLGLVVRLLEGGEEDEAGDDESEDSARSRKIEALREREALRKLRAAEDALAREAKKFKESDEEIIVRTRNPKKRSGDDFDLSDFQPETEREARLLAVIKKLQSQIKDAPAWSSKVKAAAGSSHKKGPPPSKDPEARSEYEEFARIFSKKLEAHEADERAVSEKAVILAKEREAKQRDAKARKDDAVKKPKYKVIELDAKPRKEKEGKNEKKISEKDALLRKQWEKEAAAEKESRYRKLKREGVWGVELPDNDEVESLRRALKEREAQLQKAHEALQRARKEASDLDRYRKDADRKESDNREGEREDGEGDARNRDSKVIDEYFRLRLKGAEQPGADKEPAERDR